MGRDFRRGHPTIYAPYTHFGFQHNRVFLRGRTRCLTFLFAKPSSWKLYRTQRSYLADGQHGHSGLEPVFLHDTVGRNSADDHADAANHERDDEQRPAEIVAREDVAVEQICVVGETESSCVRSKKTNVPFRFY